MSRNGNGQYTLPAGNPVVTGTTITSDWANTTLGDIATALTGSVAADGQTPMSGTLDMSNNKVTGLIDGVNPSDAATVRQISNPSITGGTINGAPIGNTNPKDGAFLGLTANTGAFTTSLTAPTVTPPTDSSTNVATTEFVQEAISAVSSGVISFNNRTGNVDLLSSDVTTALGYTPYDAGSNTILNSTNYTTYAPSLTGTGASGTWGISINGNAATANTANTVASITSGQVTTALGFTPLAPSSPALTGTPTAPTATIGTNTTQIATCAFVLANGGSGGGVTSVNGKTGVVTLNANDVGAYANTNPSGYQTLANVQALGYLTASTGVTTSTSQSIGGAKTFSSGITAPNFLINSTLGMLNNGATLNLKSGSATWNFQSDTSSVNAKNSANWDVSSDVRIKQNIVPVSNAMEKIMALNPVFYEYKNAPNTERSGFIAQEYVNVFPEAACQISTPPELSQYVNNEPTVLGISIELNAFFVKAIQELNERLIALEAK